MNNKTRNAGERKVSDLHDMFLLWVSVFFINNGNVIWSGSFLDKEMSNVMITNGSLVIKNYHGGYYSIENM
ncbi:hypothetical protein [Plebeiibacterium sediminum]|uniref:Uncharacterized protein n=1 Tax=Plebeiibacterium sediminum TaxID=2992112 RepID=A0AAE3M5V4_9BACT|nr:hypothetical protein [Plebeiobacterium sediminum]MCW3787687.1 hypothetical protein [Plebeiobacterium sediminum]